MKKKAFITGITGQDGSYLAEYLLKKGYQVHGMRRRSSQFNTSRIDHILKDRHIKSNLRLHYGDMTDSVSISNIINSNKFDEIYNLAAQSHVAVSFEIPEYTAQSDAIGCLRILEAIRLSKQNIKFYQASTSEIYGNSPDRPYNELSRMEPVSPYGTSKLFAYNLVKNYREGYGIYASNGILFNHESPRRGENFISRKVTIALARIYLGMQKYLYIGNLDAKRDWGHAKEYVEVQHLILQKEKPDDYVIATGKSYSVKDLIDCASKYLGFELKWIKDNKGIIFAYSKNNSGNIKKDQKIVIQDPLYFRPNEVNNLVADITKSKTKLKWSPKISFQKMISEMVEFDLSRLK